MKQLSLLMIFFLTTIAFAIHSMEHGQPASNFLLLDKNRLPFVTGTKKTDDLNDTKEICPIDNKTLLILILQSHQAIQTGNHVPYLEFIKKINENRITLPQQEVGSTCITQKDLENRLLSNIRAAGKPIPTVDPQVVLSLGQSSRVKNRYRTPIIISNSLAYLHYYPGHIQFVRGCEEITVLEDFSDAQEISSQPFENCKKAVDEILQKYKQR